MGRLKKVTGVKIIWNFPYFSEVGGFEKVIFHKNKKNKKLGIKMPKYCLNIHLKATYFFQYGGSLTFKIFLRSKWQLELPDLEIFLSILDFFNRKK